MNRLCGCGCGEEVTFETNMYIHGHFNRGKKFIINEKTKQKMSKSHIGKRHSDKTKQSIRISNLGKNLGKINTPETRLKISISNTGQYRSQETRLKMSINNGMKGKKHTTQSRIKMSLSTIKYLENNHYCPRRGKNENHIIDLIQREIGIQLLQNDFSLAHKISKFADAYSPKYNLVIEILEPRHFSGGKLTEYDNERELVISSKLGCMIYYIVEQKFLSSPEEEILRFKNFLTLLDENK